MQILQTDYEVLKVCCRQLQNFLSSGERLIHLKKHLIKVHTQHLNEIARAIFFYFFQRHKIGLQNLDIRNT